MHVLSLQPPLNPEAAFNPWGKRSWLAIWATKESAEVVVVESNDKFPEHGRAYCRRSISCRSSLSVFHNLVSSSFLPSPTISPFTAVPSDCTLKNHSFDVILPSSSSSSHSPPISLCYPGQPDIYVVRHQRPAIRLLSHQEAGRSAGMAKPALSNLMNSENPGRAQNTVFVVLLMLVNNLIE